MGSVIVGVDPHKKSVTLEVVDGEGKKLATGSFGTENRDYKTMLGYVRRGWPDHRWAVEGANGVGRPLAQRLLADGETCSTCPPSSQHEFGSSTPATPARPMPLTPTRSPRQHCARRSCGRWSTMRSCSPCGCW